MKTLLIPVDFTSASENAVNFAAEWSRDYKYERIILLKTFYSSMYENMILSADFSNLNKEFLNKTRETEKQKLNVLCRRLDELTGEKIKIHTAITELPLVRSIIQMVESEQPQMILLGSDQLNYSNETFISGKIISIAKASPVRVLIVPSNYRYKPLRTVLVPCDFNAMKNLYKIDSLRASAKWDNVKLIVLNVDSAQRHLNPDEKFKQAENNLHNYLKNFTHEIYYVADKNVIEGILNFNKLNEVELMIALPGEYSFLNSLTHKSVSEGLYRNTKVPVMILK